MNKMYYGGDITFAIILVVLIVGSGLLCFVCYKIFRNCEPDQPDAVRLGIIPPVVIHADARIVPVMTTATYVNADYHVVNAEYAEESKTEESRIPENMV